MPVRLIVIDGRRAWLKSYPEAGQRRLSLGLLRGLARRLGLSALKPPPHRGGRTAKELKARRLRELRAQGIRVPADLGDSLASRLQQVRGDVSALDALTRAATVAIGDAHRRGAYFGQPVPRNMTIDATGIGFIDFEEDPLEVMPLEQAQARDWLLFAFGIAKYYDDRPDALSRLLDEAFSDESVEVGAHVHAVGERLHGFAYAIGRFGRSARTLAHSIIALRSAAR